MVNPLFLHPSDGATSIQVDKLRGSSDYRSWKRGMEISLSSKWKLGFVKGTTLIPTDDPIKADMWESCYNMVISWITINLSPTIRKSVIYMNTSKNIWNNLEHRFSLTNGSRKFKLNKDIYDLKQGSLTINDYYSAMKTIWEELESLNILHVVTNPTAEITKLLADIETQKEKSKLFQFWNGLNDVCSPQRSQLLLLNPLSIVESASATLQQEEAQRDILLGHKSDTDVGALYGKGPAPKVFHCTACGGKSHTSDRCWSVVGYPKWHANYPGNQTTSQGRQYHSSTQSARNKWKPNYRAQGSKSANVAQSISSGHDVPLFSPQQLEQLAQLMNLTPQSPVSGGEIMETSFSGMLSCNNVYGLSNEWIIDSGASDHMTPHIQNLQAPIPARHNTHINLPTGSTTAISILYCSYILNSYFD